MPHFTTTVGRINDILCAVNTLVWDSRTMMPKAGAATRGQQIATLMGLARAEILSPALKDAAQAYRAAATTERQKREADAVLAAIDHHSAIPTRLLQAQAEERALANAAWAEARATSNFALFSPYLERIFDLAREEAAAIGYEAHPYDALVKGYEPGETAASLSTLFGELRRAIVPLLEEAKARPLPRTDFLYRDYAPETQKIFCETIAAKLGYDFSRGRFDTTVHPFEISFTRNDVRITSRWNPNYLPMAIFGAIHETGHALYEQGCDEALVRSAHATDMIGLYAVAGTSFGMHESQSRLYENHIGRNPAFWLTHFGSLRDVFPEQLSDVTAEEFARAVNRVEPGFIRVEADELTYDLHIMLRVELEMAMLAGDLSPKDLPAAWREIMKRDLGLIVPDDAHGPLQDVHWSTGYIGSFPTYTIGNITAAQLMAHFDATEPHLRQSAVSGDTGGLNEALKTTVWQHGRSLTRHEILANIGKNAGDPADYIAYLTNKFASNP